MFASHSNAIPSAASLRALCFAALLGTAGCIEFDGSVTHANNINSMTQPVKRALSFSRDQQRMLVARSTFTGSGTQYSLDVMRDDGVKLGSASTSNRAPRAICAANQGSRDFYVLFDDTLERWRVYSSGTPVKMKTHSLSFVTGLVSAYDIDAQISDYDQRLYISGVWKDGSIHRAGVGLLLDTKQDGLWVMKRAFIGDGASVYLPRPVVVDKHDGSVVVGARDRLIRYDGFLGSPSQLSANLAGIPVDLDGHRLLVAAVLDPIAGGDQLALINPTGATVDTRSLDQGAALAVDLAEFFASPSNMDPSHSFVWASGRFQNNTRLLSRHRVVASN